MFWHPGSSSYDRWVKSLRMKAESMHQFLFGFSSWTGEPLVVSEDMLYEHIWGLGTTGSGKSAMILAPFVSQIIERRKFSVVFIDQKDDPASFNNCLDAAHEAGLPFKYFSVVPGDESYIYKHFGQKIHRKTTPMQQAERFSLASGTDYEEVYGASFFQAKDELVICNYLSNYKDPPIDNFAQLLKLMDDKSSYRNIGHLEDWADASHLRALFARLASVSSLNGPTQNSGKERAVEQAIELSDLLRSPAVYYFKVPAGAGKNTIRFVSRSILQNLFAAAGMRESDEKTTVVVVIDEFQLLVGPGIETFLEQCRSRGICCVLAHQSLGQLERSSMSLGSVIQACTGTHLVLDAIDDESVEHVQKRSGQAYYTLASWSQEAPSDSSSFYNNDFFQPWKAASTDGIRPPLVNGREELGYRLDQNTIRRLSADPTIAFFAVKKDTSFCRLGGVMIPIRCFFHIDKATFDERSKAPWPKWDRPETVIVQSTSPLDKSIHAAPPSMPIQTAPMPPGSAGAILNRLRRNGKPAQ